jgi:hypothetical protein
MASSGYTAIVFVANEQPTTAKWNLIGSNDSSFNLGTGLEDSVIINRHLATKAATPDKLDTPYQQLSYFFNPAFTGTSAGAADITGMTKSITTKGGGLLVFFCLPIKVSTNTATIYLVVDGIVKGTFQTSTLTTLYIPNLMKVDSLSAGAHTVKLQYSIPGGATFTCQIYESGVMTLVETGNT